MSTSSLFKGLGGENIPRVNRSTLNLYTDTKKKLTKVKARGQSYDHLVQQLVKEHYQLEEIKEREDIIIG